MAMKLSERFVPVFYLIGRYKKIVGVVLLVSLIAGVLENLTLGALHVFLQYFFNEGANPGSIQLGKYFDVFLNLLPVKNPVNSAGILILIILLMKNISMMINNAMIGKVSGDTLYDLKKMMMDKYSQAPYQYFLDTKYGKLSYAASMAPARVAQLMLHLPNAGTEIIKISMIMAFLLYYNWQATIFCSVVLLMFSFFIRYLSQKVSYHTGKGRVEASRDNVNEFNEFVTGIKHLNIFGKTQRWLDMFNRSSRTFSRLYIKDAFWMAVPKELLEFTFFGGAIGGLLIVRSMVSGSVASIIPSVGVYFMAMMKILPSANNIGRLHMQITNLLSDADLVYKVLHKDFKSTEDGKKLLGKFDADIKFNGVSFYHQNRDIILDNISLTIKKGKITAIVGESGSGKSTILNLILRLFRPTKGEIAIDGQPLNSIRLSSWLEQVGFVGQDTFVFHSTIFENISFGSAQYSREDVIKAAGIAGIHDFIVSLPEGYETVVGERGMKLSGGQQQRVAIARAIIRNPEVLILDEATSALDSVTERGVQKALDKTLEGRTAIMVAHRLSTIEHADNIIVLKEGQVVEEGTHEQLLAQKREYWRLYTMQNKGIIDPEAVPHFRDKSIQLAGKR